MTKRLSFGTMWADKERGLEVLETPTRPLTERLLVPGVG